jgi:hypothetical protein
MAPEKKRDFRLLLNSNSHIEQLKQITMIWDNPLIHGSGHITTGQKTTTALKSKYNKRLSAG